MRRATVGREVSVDSEIPDLQRRVQETLEERAWLQISAVWFADTEAAESKQQEDFAERTNQRVDDQHGMPVGTHGGAAITASDGF